MTGSCTGSNSEIATAGPGTPPPPPYLQIFTTATCPATMTRAIDARDNHTYWIKKIGTLCWMMTNLGYTGGGTNTYSDTRTLTDGTSDGTSDYLNPKYYVVPSTTNFTAEPTDPSTLTNGTGQYGYLYNWCAAMGSQVVTSTCASTTSTDNWNHSVSICPSGWRLPVGNGGEFSTLNATVNGGLTNVDGGLIGANWLGQRSGKWDIGFVGLGTGGFYWSSSQNTAANAHSLFFNSTSVIFSNGNKYIGYAVRCVAAV